MSSNAMNLKARIKNYARENKIAAQVVLQNYMFERFLAKLSHQKKGNIDDLYSPCDMSVYN